jgi:uncharacterized protein (TIGR03546 family)
MFGLKLLAKLIKVLRSGESPGKIAGGFILGMIIGLTPIWSLHNLIVLILLIILNVNLGMAVFSFLLFSGFAYLIDPLFHSLGYWILVDIPALQGLWTTMYNTPVIGLSKFNNTVVMGSLVVSIIMLFPAYFAAKWFVIYYREHIDAKMQKWKIVQMVKSSKIYNLYEKIRNIGV